VFQIDEIYRVKRQIEEASYKQGTIHGVRLAPDVLESLKRPLPGWIKEPKEEMYSRAAIWGIPCIVDNSLAPGTWEAAYDRETWLRWREEA
jgi:hypothetical protein